MSFPFSPTWLKENSPKFAIVCRVSSPIASVSQGMRTNPCATSCGLMRWSRRTTPRSISGWSSSSSLLHVSSRRLTLFQLFRILQRGMIAADFLCRHFRNRIRNRFSLNRRASSNTRSPCGLYCHSTSIPRWISRVGSRRLDSPYFWRVELLPASLGCLLP